MTRYRKKPVEVEAWRIGSREAYPDWLMKAVEDETALIGVDGHWLIKTLEGDHIGNIGDYIIQGIKGELYPCKPDIFEQTYELTEATAWQTREAKEMTISSFQEITGTNYVDAKRILSALRTHGAKVVF